MLPTPATSNVPVVIGILALQGAYEAHVRMLDVIGAKHRLVRTAADLQTVDGLIVPGGESTTMLHQLQQEEGLWQALLAFVHQYPCLGTCAGLIVLAQQVQPPQASLGALQVRVQRNAYGRQRESRVTTASTALAGGPIEVVLIRAPRIVAWGADVQILAQCDGDPVLVQQGRVMGCSFHPELGKDTRIHTRLLQACEAVKMSPASGS
ncbi:pyridoxal 5'-phosphate synthase glutaminase subunit PdxT [Lampropedia puyangensis]|uniref:glutaminase n=1 Tax=Lampropedia puyangensis TaxID=1330072 RepID=A0A4S8EXQ0_9BURK|nr:pyridoxal 5'-phosphate synthase glutaminase subunit PdxT [Lampropedia puyangensis]THT98674.1 pyridoxal 5'-phosphate synthase glutaminase subunit PdxT [Lampropedia puyangensis]